MMFKGCARCCGDLYREEGLGQAELVCLQCGYRVTVAPITRWLPTGSCRPASGLLTRWPERPPSVKESKSCRLVGEPKK
jgi:hypothetical protein